MKINYPQLETQLNKSLSPIYLVASDELLLVEEAASLIRQKAKAANFLERIVITIESNSQWEKTFLEATQSLSLFSNKRLIELNFLQVKLTATHGKFLQAYAEHPINDVIVLIRTQKIDAKTEKSAWFRALDPHMLFVAIWPIQATQLPQWIIQHAKKINCTLSTETAQLIAQQSEGNLLAASQEIEKMALLQLSDKSLTDKNSLSMTDNACFNVFDLVESFIAKNSARALRILRNLIDEDVEPTFILWALTRELRMLSQMSEQLKQGVSFASLCQQFHIFEKRQASLRAFLNRVPTEMCYQLLLKTAEIDRLIKGAEKGNVFSAFENLILMT